MDLTFSFIAEAVCQLINSLSPSELFPTQGKTFPESHLISRRPLGLLWLCFYSGRSASSLCLTWDCYSFQHGVSAFGAQESIAHLIRVSFNWFHSKPEPHSFGVSKPIIPTPHILVALGPICGIGLLPCSLLDKCHLNMLCPSSPLQLPTTFFLPYLCHCVLGILFMMDTLSCVLGSL